ncbi:MAG: class I SAM-dependent methyltransferase [Chloroflexota bacterium]|nr:class I SAM-dependent methyltransferase [Chloroflexota bacterium]
MVCFDRVADIYDATRRPVRPEVVEALAEELSDCSSVLDLGVGTGRLAVPLVERGLAVVGVDLSRRMMEQARAKGVADVMVGDISRLPFRAKSVDAVLAMHVLHLVKDPAAVLAQARATARKKLVSIVERYEPPSQGITYAYRRALKSRGLVSASRWEQPELGLADVVQPRRFEALVRYREQLNAEVELKMLENRIWSTTWDVPDDVHRAVLAELSREFAGRTRTYDCEVCLLSWGVTDLTDAALAEVASALDLS